MNTDPAHEAEPDWHPRGTALRREVLHSRLLTVERNIPASAIAALLAQPLLAWLFRERFNTVLLLGWLALMTLIVAWRIAIARRFLRVPPGPEAASAMLRRMMWAALPGSLGLLVTTLWLFTPDDPASTMVLALMPILAFTGQVASAAPPVRVLALLLGPSLVGLVLLCLIDGQQFSLLLAMMLVLFAAAMLRVARNIGAKLDSEVALRIENRHLAEQRDLQRRRAERASNTMSRFLAAASHDIRQPVHALGLFLSAFDDRELSGRNRTLFLQLQGCATGLREMLDAVLDLSRADAGTLDVVLAPVALQPVLDAVERDFAPVAEAKGLVLRSVPSSACVWAETFVLERILRNLVSNAVRYTSRGGVLLSARQRGEMVELAVWDTGCGIAEADREHLFDEFTRGPAAHGDAPGGLGLGLAIAHRFAAALGGSITLSSRPGRGSVFRVLLRPGTARGANAQSR